MKLERITTVLTAASNSVSRTTLSPHSFLHFLSSYGYFNRLWIAYSGGHDSRVLLELCADSRLLLKGLTVLAVHVHHGLHSSAEIWSEHCKHICLEKHIPFHLIKVNAHAEPGESPEEAARVARYNALRSLLLPGDALLTAQHQDDQAETVLLQLLRGAGLPGLAAMPSAIPFGAGWLLRPLLDYPREVLHRYAIAHRLVWCEDPSNDNTHFDRNFIRHTILPILKERWPSAAKTVSRSARHCAEAEASLNTFTQDSLKTTLHHDRQSLSIERLLCHPEAEQKRILRAWIKAKGLRSPSAHVIRQVLKESISASLERNPIIRWSAGEIRRYRDHLYLFPPTAVFDTSSILPWDGVVPLLLANENGQLRVVRTNKIGINAVKWEQGQFTVRYRQGGEFLRPIGRRATYPLKKLFQEKGIPPWVRERIPLVYLDDELIAVGDHWIAERWAGIEGQDNVALQWSSPEWLCYYSEAE